MKNNKQREGISLIVLIITIVIIIILTATTIMILAGDNGIIKKAKNAKIESDKTSIKEAVTMAWQDCESKYVLGADQFKIRKDYYTVENLNNSLKSNGEIIASSYEFIENGITSFEYKINGQQSVYYVTVDGNGTILVDVFKDTTAPNVKVTATVENYNLNIDVELSNTNKNDRDINLMYFVKYFLDDEFTQIYSGKETEFNCNLINETWCNLDCRTKYIILVKAQDESGNEGIGSCEFYAGTGAGRLFDFDILKRNMDKRGIYLDYDDANRFVDIVLDQDFDLRKSEYSDYYQDEYCYNRGSKGSTLELKCDFECTLDMEPVMNVFEAIRDTADECYSEGSLGQSLLSQSPIRGKFTFDIIYDENMQFENKDELLQVGYMNGFNDSAHEIFIDTGRSDDIDLEHPGYRKLSIDLEIKAPSDYCQGISHRGAFENILLYADLKQFYYILLNDICFEIPGVTVSIQDIQKSTYYTMSASISGVADFGMGEIIITTTSKQLIDNDNNYNGVQDWQKISATMALLIRNIGGGGGGGA